MRHVHIDYLMLKHLDQIIGILLLKISSLLIKVIAESFISSQKLRNFEIEITMSAV